MTTSLASLIRSGNLSRGMSMRPASESNFQSRSCSDFSSARTTFVYSVYDGYVGLHLSSGHLELSRLTSGLLEPQICVGEILVHLSPEGLFLVARIQSGFRHGDQPPLPSLSFVLLNIFGLAPLGRLRMARNLVLG